jgi:O-antigen/teichoic acid export membrane protein
MGIVIKQAMRTTMYSYIGAVLGFLTVWYMNRQWLTTEQNGLLNLLISISLITGSLSNLGMAGVTIRMFPHFRDSINKHNGFLFYPLVITVVGFMLFLGLYFFFREDAIARNMEKSQLFAENIYYLIPLTFFLALFYIFDAYSRSIYLTTAGVVVKEVLLRVVILIAAYCYHIKMISFDSFVLIYCSAFCFIGLALAVFLYSKNEFHLGRVRNYLTRPMRKEMTKVAGYSIITGLSSLLISSIDKIIVNDKLGLASAGVFAIATYFGSIIQIPARSIVRITSSVIADSWKTNNIENIRNVYHKTCLNQMVLGTILFLAIWVNLDNIMLLMPKEYEEGKWVIVLMAFAYLIDMSTGVNGVIIATSKFFRYDTYFMLLLVTVTYITNLLLIPIYGLTGAALAACLTYFLYNLLRYLFIWKKFGMQPYNIAFAKVLLFAVISYFLAMVVPPTHYPYLDLIIRGSIVCGSFAVMIYKSHVAPDINLTVQKALLKIRS